MKENKIKAIIISGIILFYCSQRATACVSYSDDFSNPATINYYNYFNVNSQSPGTPASTGYQITGGELNVVGNQGNNNMGGVAVVNSAYFSGTTDYQIDVDAEMDSTSANGQYGIFGIAFRVQSNGSFYSFQWNADPSRAGGSAGDWEIEKWGSYLAGGNTNYTYGTWVHLTVVVSGNTFTCYLNYVQIYQVTDNSYTSGAVGVRTYAIANGNVARFKNFVVNTCARIGTPTFTPVVTETWTPTETETSIPTETATWTPTATITQTFTMTATFSMTPTLTITPSITATGTITQTFTVSPTYTNTMIATPTPCLALYKNSPNPFTVGTNFIFGSCIQVEVKLKIYTISGELVDELTQQGQPGMNSIYWDAKNKAGKGVASGTYIYSFETVEGMSKQKQWGKMAVVK